MRKWTSKFLRSTYLDMPNNRLADREPSCVSSWGPLAVHPHWGILQGTEGLLCLYLQRGILQGTASLLWVYLHRGIWQGTAACCWYICIGASYRELKACFAYMCSGAVGVSIVGHLAGNCRPVDGTSALGLLTGNWRRVVGTSASGHLTRNSRPVVGVCAVGLVAERYGSVHIFGIKTFLPIYVHPALSALQFICTLNTHSVEICSYYKGLQYPQNIQLENFTILISSYAFRIQRYSDPSFHIHHVLWRTLT
jgi:hypothetical protein